MASVRLCHYLQCQTLQIKPNFARTVTENKSKRVVCSIFYKNEVVPSLQTNVMRKPIDCILGNINFLSIRAHFLYTHQSLLLMISFTHLHEVFGVTERALVTVHITWMQARWGELQRRIIAVQNPQVIEEYWCGNLIHIPPFMYYHLYYVCSLQSRPPSSPWRPV